MKLVGAALAVWVAGSSVYFVSLNHRPKPISVEQQNRVMRLQIEAYKAAINWKMAELRQYEAHGDPAKLEAATHDAQGWKASLDTWDKRISEEAERIKQEDRCEKCIPLADFTWKQP